MHGHDEMEAILYRLEQVLAVVNLDLELSLHGVVHHDASADVGVVLLVVPVGLERDGDAVPPLGVDVSESVAAHLDDPLGHDVGLLGQVDVVLVGVVEPSRGHSLNAVGHTQLSLHVHKTSAQHLSD